MDVLSFNEKSLNSMKYHQLLKLSQMFNVRKRWAKKTDLIKCLLDIQQKRLGSCELQESVKNEDIEWKDGIEIIRNSIPPENSTHRSTFVIEKKMIEDARATYNLTEGISKIMPDTRLRRLTFNVSKPSPQDNGKSKLTVPLSRSQTRNDLSKTRSAKDSPLKLSNRSIAIKKSKVSRVPRSIFSDVPTRGVQPIFEPQTLNDKLKKPEGHKIRIDKAIHKIEKVNNGNIKTSSRRKSKSDDPSVRRTSTKITFQTPPATTTRHFSASKTAEPTFFKPITASKMPNFAAMHQRQFQKMESLDEYVHKKSERIKKLFGTPNTNHSMDKVLKPQNKELNRETQTDRRVINSKIKATPKKENLQRARKIMDRGPLRTQTDVKDKNRSHIHGIRTNRRFELQMKFRNL